MIAENFNPMLAALPVFKDQELALLNMPLIYIAGEKDVTVNVNKTITRIKKLIPQAETNVLENRGHVIFDTMETIIPFLNK